MISDKNHSGAQLLYAEDDAPSGRLVQRIAETEGYHVKVVTSGQECLRVLQIEKPDLLLLDLHLPDTSGLDLLARTRLRCPETPVIVVTASNSVDHVIKALQGGAIDYITKPVDHQRLIVSLGHALKITRQQQDLTKLRAELKETYRLEHMIGSSAGMTELRSLVRQVAQSDATVLISGDSGTGTALVAG